MKVEFEQPNGLWLSKDCSGSESLSTHLTIKECWNNSCKAQTKLKVYQASWKAIEAWEYIRNRYGKPITINSAYREEEYNRSVGGEANSLHLKFCAFDNGIGKVSDADFQKWIGWCEVACVLYGLQSEVGRYNWGIHTGFIEKLPYNYNGDCYVFDRRSTR